MTCVVIYFSYNWLLLNVFFDAQSPPRIPQTVADSFAREADGGKLQALKDHVQKFNAKHASQITTSPSSATVTSSPTKPARTEARPTFADGDRPLDFTQCLLPAVVLGIDEFDSTKEFLGHS